MSKGWIIQGLIEAHMTITAYCQNARCAHHKVLDLDALRDRLGPDAPAMHHDIAPRLRCEKCGGKKVGLIYAPDSKKTFGMGEKVGP